MDAFADWLLQPQAQPQPQLNDGGHPRQTSDDEVSDLLLFEQSLKVENKKISNADLVPWLDGFATSDDRDGILAVTRVVWSYHNPTATPETFHISEDNMQYLFNRFELRRTRCLVPLGFSYQGGKLSPTKKQSFALRYTGDLRLAWQYDFMTNRTEAIFQGGAYWSRCLQECIQSQQRLALHPLFLGFVSVLAVLGDVIGGLDMATSAIHSVECRTRHSHFLTGQIATGNYASLSAKMSGQAQNLANGENLCALMLQNLDWLSDFRWPQELEKPSWLDRVVEELDECSRSVRNLLKGQEPRRRFLSERVNIQLTALFNLISQQETRLSISVAQDSRTLASATKDDSTAMKTLAAVTVVFLPGTFVAALFSMPLFQWDTHTKPHSAISDQFWIYWATTLPLTITTLALWFAWVRLQTRKHRARDKEGRDALNHEVNEDSRSYGPGNIAPDTEKGSKQA